MVRINDFNENTTSYELFFFLYVKLIKKEITAFDQIVSLTEKIPQSNTKEHALKNAFYLLRRLNWGFFNQLSPDEYPKLWKKLTIPNQEYPFAADLKRNMTITNIYIGFIDIHGYTAFCFNSGINTSRLQKLDDFIDKNITRMARENNVICKRARGDEIILGGSSALDVVETTVQIADYFAGKNIIKNEKIIKSRGSRPAFLPDMTISAGIAGGKKYTPLIITSDGDLSGTVVNTAARLQAQANKISKNTNRILVSNHVAGNFIAEATIKKDPFLTEHLIDFFNAGHVGFKGINLTIFEVIIDDKEKYRMKYQGIMIDLIDSLRKKLWNENVFSSLIELICDVCNRIPLFSLKLPENNGNILTFNNISVIKLARDSLDLFMHNHYEEAVSKLSEVATLLPNIPEIDYFVVVYSENVYASYKQIIDKYSTGIKELIVKHTEEYFTKEEKEKMDNMKSQSVLLDRIKDRIYGKIPKEKRKIVWTSIVNHEKKDLDFKIYFGK